MKKVLIAALIAGFSLSATAAGKTKVMLRGKGAGLPAIAMPLKEDQRVVVQLANDQNTCWQTVHRTPARRNDEARFSDRAEQ